MPVPDARALVAAFLAEVFSRAMPAGVVTRQRLSELVPPDTAMFGGTRPKSEDADALRRWHETFASLYEWANRFHKPKYSDCAAWTACRSKRHTSH